MKTPSGELRFLLKHSMVYGIGNALSRAVAFLLLPLYTRYLTPADYGVLELIDATCAVAGAVIGLGLGAALARFYYELEQDGRRSLVSTAYVLALAGCGLIAVPLMVVAPWIAEEVLDARSFGLYVQVGFAGLLAGTVGDLGLILLRMEYRSRIYVTISVLTLVFGVALNVVLIVGLHLGALAVLVTTLACRLSVAIPLTAMHLGRSGLRFSAPMASDLLKYSAPLIPNTIVTMISAYADRYYLKYFVSIGESGIYGLARKIPAALQFLVTGPFMAAFLPRRFEIARLPGAPRVFGRVFDFFVIALLVPVSFAGIFAREILVVMTTPAYYRAGLVLPVLLLEAVVLGAKFHFEFGVLYAKKTKTYTAINTLAAGTTIVLGYLLVRRFGMWGAATASLLGAVLQGGLLYAVSQRHFPIAFALPRHASALALLAAVMVVSQIFAPESFALTLLVKAGLFGVFVVALLRLHGVRRGTFAELTQRFGVERQPL